MGSVKPEAFATLFNLMEEAFKENKELVFFVSENKRPDSKAKATLAVTISQKPQNSGYGNRSGGSPFGAQPAAPAPASPVVSGFTQRSRPAPKVTKENPPKDELESFLESFDKE